MVSKNSNFSQLFATFRNFSQLFATKPKICVAQTMKMNRHFQRPPMPIHPPLPLIDFFLGGGPECPKLSYLRIKTEYGV
jgi:hypothetical protein